MRKMKKKISIISITLLMFLTQINLMAISTVNYAMGGSGTATTGSSGSITISLKGIQGGLATHKFSVKSDNPGVVQIKGKTLFVETSNDTVTVQYDAIGKGTANIVIYDGTGFDMELGEKFNSSGSKAITVSDKAASKPNVTTPPVKDNTEEEKKKPQLTEEQKKAAEEEKRKNELEAQKRIPLIKEVSIVSESEKLNGEELTKIALTDNTFSYSYAVPRRINSLKLSVPEVEGVTLKYDSNVTLAEDQEETNVVISATKGEISQEFTIVLKQDLSEEVTRTFSGIEHKVYKDELVDKYLSTLGLSKEDTETQGHYYAIGDNAVQLLVDEENNAGFFLLDESKEIVEEVALVENTETSVLIAKQSKDTEERTISGIKQTLNENEKVVTLEDIDSSLVMSKNLQSWDLEEGSVFLGIDNAKEESLFVIGQESGLSKVIVAFDKPVEGLDPLVVGLSVALGAVLFANAVFFGTSLYRKRKYNM